MARYRFDQIAINSTDKRKPEDKDQADYIGLEHLDSGSLKVTRWGSKVPLKGEKLVMKKGDVLFGKRNAYLRRAAISPHDGLFSAHGMVLRPKTEIVDSEFFPFFIGSDYFFDRAIKISVGSLSPTVNWRDLKKEEFDLPSIPEQKKLTKVLKAISITKYAYEDLVRQTDELVKSQFIEMFGDPVSNSQDRRQVPFSEFITDIRYGTSQPPKFSASGEYKFIRATNIKRGRIVPDDILRIDKSGASKIEKCRLDGGEIIIVRSGVNTGDTCVVTDEYKGQYAGYDIIIKLDLKKANPVFFNELLNTHYMNDVVKPLTVRSAQPHLNSQQVQNLPMIVVSIDEQNEFAAIVAQSDKSKFELNEAIKDLDAMYKRIIKDNLG